MKQVLKWLPFLGSILLLFAACSSGTTAVSAPVANAPTVQEAAAVEPVAEVAAAAPHNPYELTLITQTGRPQLLNAFASW